MTQLTADQYRRQLDSVAKNPAMADDNIRLPAGSGAGIATGSLAVGALLLVATIAGSQIYGLKHALAAFEVGVVSVTALSLGGLFWTMILHITNSGWGVTVRRFLEHLMMMLPACVVMLGIIVLIEIGFGGVLLTWIGIDPAENYLINHKKAFLNEPFFVIRFFLYAGVWLLLASRFWRFSTEQDRSGDRFLSNQARKTAAWGLPLFALSTAFFSFDFLMAMDYRFFSTMWGVYYFASATFGSVAVVLITLCVLRAMGYLTGAVTSEHTHDLGKLLFGFTVFWAYIAFSQYFLLWYSNIPEETIWFIVRQQGGWENVATLLVIGHFLAPFLILLFRPVKRHSIGVALAAAWMLLMLVLDMIFIIRPMVYAGPYAAENPGPGAWWLDFVGITGVLLVWAALYIRRLPSQPLVPLKDPKLPESLHHKNYV
ncbi:MAG: hypothetical protein ACF8SC_02040 [Phycisphaerales bacterium JB037]